MSIAHDRVRAMGCDFPRSRKRSEHRGVQGCTIVAVCVDAVRASAHGGRGRFAMSSLRFAAIATNAVTRNGSLGPLGIK
jgi:hypothetical protein